MRVKSILKAAGLCALLLIAALALVLGGSILFFKAGVAADRADQRQRVASLAAARAAAPAAAARAVAAERALPDDLPIDRLRLLATHNSYRKRADGLRLFYIDLVQPGEAAKLDYGHRPLADQLESGLRAFELDLRARKDGGFAVAHVPLVDDRSTCPDFGLALDEVRLWSESRPGHAPIVLLLELKTDYLFLDPGLAGFGAAELDGLDALLRERLGAKLYAPDELRGSAPDPRAAVAAAWPPLGALRGRVVVILHPDAAFRALYRSGRPNLAGRAMFTALGGDRGPTAAELADPDGGDAVFALANEPDAAALPAALAAGLIVRTRADADGKQGAAGLAAALATGAQIVSTDFPPAYPSPTGYAAALPGGATVEALAPGIPGAAPAP